MLCCVTRVNAWREGLVARPDPITGYERDEHGAGCLALDEDGAAPEAARHRGGMKWLNIIISFFAMATAQYKLYDTQKTYRQAIKTRTKQKDTHTIQKIHKIMTKLIIQRGRSSTSIPFRMIHTNQRVHKSLFPSLKYITWMRMISPQT